MGTRRLAELTGLLFLVAGCTTPEAVPGWVSSSGTLTLDTRGEQLFVADADHRAVFLLNAGTGAVNRKVELDAEPAEVISDGAAGAYVSLRTARSVALLAADGTVRARGDSGTEPVGLARSIDGRHLYVANLTGRSVSVLDAATLQRVRPDIEVGIAPRTVAAIAPDRIYVGDFLVGALYEVRPSDGVVTRRLALNQPATASCGGGDDREPTQVAALALSPSGERLYAAHVQSRLDITSQRTNEWGMPTGAPLAAAVAPAISTIQLAENKLLIEPTDSFECWRDGCGFTQPDFPPPLLLTSCGPPPGMDAPSSIIVDRTGRWLFVADHNSDAVATVSTTRDWNTGFAFPDRGIFAVTRVGARPMGMALAADNRRLFVHSQFDYSVAVVTADPGGGLTVLREHAYARSPLLPQVERGRRLFHSAVDPRVTSPQLGGLSCSSCHPEGGTDGLTWRFHDDTRPGSAPRSRNTPSLWGVHETSPYHWDGIAQSLPAFNTGMITTMGGSGLSPTDLADVDAYLATLRQPDLSGPDTQAEHGKDLFEGKAGCAGCHAAPLFTDRSMHGLRVGLMLDTPSLRGLAATPPYLHNGSARTLREVFSGIDVDHDLRRVLTEAELDALEAYLKTL